MTTVKLTPTELYVAGAVGTIREVRAYQSGDQTLHGQHAGDAWGAHLQGAASELAVAKHLGTYPAEALQRDRHAGDVGRFEVRATAHQSGRLIVHPDDPADRAYVLTIGYDGTWRVAGWLYGHEAQSERYWSDPTGKGRPAFFVPAGDLHPMASLPR